MRKQRSKILNRKDMFSIINIFSMISLLLLIIAIVILAKRNYDIKTKIETSIVDIYKVIVTEGNIVHAFSNYTRENKNNRHSLVMNSIVNDHKINVQLLHRVSVHLRGINFQNSMFFLSVILMCVLQTMIMLFFLFRISHQITKSIQSIKMMVLDIQKMELSNMPSLLKVGILQELYNKINVLNMENANDTIFHNDECTTNKK